MYYVYIIANWNNKVIYTGVTNNLERRIFEHKSGTIDGFAKRYVYIDLSILNVRMT